MGDSSNFLAVLLKKNTCLVFSFSGEMNYLVKVAGTSG